MSVLTEAALRVILKDADLEAMKEYSVDSGVIVTPSARSWLLENKIDLVVGGKRVLRAGKPQGRVGKNSDSETSPVKKTVRYKVLDGGQFFIKPEHMTALHGNTLVCKTHGIISLRGKLDSLAARIIETQMAFQRLCLPKGFDDLEETLEVVHSIMRAEVLGEELESIFLFGMDEAELRNRSHMPKQHYGIPHFFASAQDGEAVVLLNSLRAASREAELQACCAFKTESGESERPDIIMALNRLSSAYYVMMLRVKTGEYDQ